MRSAISTVGSVSVLTGGVAYGIGLAICGGMGWEQKAIVWLQGVGVCAEIATSMNEVDPINPVTIPGRLAGESVENLAQVAAGSMSAQV